LKAERKKGLLWTAEDVAEYLGTSISQADFLMKNGDINSIQLYHEKRLRTTKEMVDNWLTKTFKRK